MKKLLSFTLAAAALAILSVSLHHRKPANAAGVSAPPRRVPQITSAHPLIEHRTDRGSPEAAPAAPPAAEPFLAAAGVEAAVGPHGLIASPDGLRSRLIFSRGSYSDIRNLDNGAVECTGPDGLVERYESRDAGIEQSFIIPARPAGDFVLEARLASNLPARAIDRGLAFGDRLTYTDAVAVDAAGSSLPLDIHYDAGRLRISIPAAWLATAAFPVVLDPLIGGPQAVDAASTASSPDESTFYRYNGLAYNSTASEYLALWRDTVAGVEKGRWARLSSSGAQIGSAQTLPGAPAQYGPQASFSPSLNQYLVVYEEVAGTGRNIMGLFLSPSGVPGAPFVVTSQAGFNLSPHLAYHAASSRWLVVWNNKTTVNGTAGTLFGRFVYTSGAMDPSFQIGATGGAFKNVRVASSANRYCVANLGSGSSCDAHLLDASNGALIQTFDIGPWGFVGTVDVAASGNGFLAVCGTAKLEADVTLSMAVRGRIINADATTGPIATLGGPYNSGTGFAPNPENTLTQGDMFPPVAYSAGAGEYLALNWTIYGGGAFPGVGKIVGSRIAANGTVLQPNGTTFPNDMVFASGLENYGDAAAAAGPANQVCVFYVLPNGQLFTQILALAAVANQPPAAPTQIAQKRSTGVAMAVGEQIMTNQTITFECSISDPDAGQRLFAQIEYRPVGQAFVGHPTIETAMSAGGVVSVSKTFTAAADYLWQIRVKDEHGAVSPWVDFSAAAVDFKVVTTADTSAPVSGAVNDGPGADIDAQISLTTIQANWSGFSDPQTGVSSYAWAIGTTPGGTNIQAYTNVALATSASNTALTLTAGTTYYVSVRATNADGLQTTVTTDGVSTPAVDTTPPVAGAVNDGSAADIDTQTSATSLASNWSGFNDPQSGITLYEWAVGTTAGATNVQPFTAVGTSTSASGAFTLTPGSTYFVTVRATNGAGLAVTASSDGVQIAVPDTTPPVAGVVNDGSAADIDTQTSATSLASNWSGFNDPQSGITLYEWAVGTTAGAINVQPFTAVGTSTNASSAFTLTPGSTYYVTVRATNGVGLQTTASSDGVTILDSTPPVAGTVNDGAGADIDLQTSTGSLAANWSGFTDPQSGITLYEWAVGTTAGAANVQPFTAVGVATNAFGAFTLTPGSTYYVTVRATNGSGLQVTASSDGVLVASAAEPDSSIVTSGLYSPATYAGSITGSAVDASGSGLASVTLRIQRFSDGLYFTGAGWGAAAWLPATGTSNWSYAFTPASGEAYGLESRASNNAGTVEATFGTAGITYDADAPASSITTTGSLNSAAWTGAISGTASDATSGVASVAVTIQRLSDNLYWNGSTWIAAPTWLPAAGTAAWSYSFVPADGAAYAVESRATDLADNAQAAPSTSTFDYNVSSPDSTILTFGAYNAATWTGSIAGSAATTNGAAVTLVELTIRDAAGLYWNGSAWTATPAWLAAAGTTSWSVPFAPTDGVTYAVESRARDNYGAVETSFGAATFLVDLTGPATTIVTQGSIAASAWGGLVQGTASDSASGVASVEVTISRADGLCFDGASWGAAATWLPAAGLSNWAIPFAPNVGESYDVAARATDAAGNVGAPSSASFTIERDAPRAESFHRGSRNRPCFAGLTSRAGDATPLLLALLLAGLAYGARRG